MAIRSPKPLPAMVFLILACCPSPGSGALFITLTESAPLEPRQAEVSQGFDISRAGEGTNGVWIIDAQPTLDVGLGRGFQVGIGLPNLRTTATGSDFHLESCAVAGWVLAQIAPGDDHRPGVSLCLGIERCEESEVGGLDLILERRSGPWTMVGNFCGAREWSRAEAGGIIDHLEFRCGLSRPVLGNLAAGFEAGWGWSASGDSPLVHRSTRVGPILSFAGESRWVTAGWLFDRSGLQDRGPSSVQVLLGMVF